MWKLYITDCVTKSIINNSHYHRNRAQYITTITNYTHCTLSLTKASHYTACSCAAQQFVTFTKPTVGPYFEAAEPVHKLWFWRTDFAVIPVIISQPVDMLLVSEHLSGSSDVSNICVNDSHKQCPVNQSNVSIASVLCLLL